MRYSSRRDAILRVLSATTSHPDAEWVYRKVRETIPNVSLGTVYRNLREMGEAGLLETVETESGQLHFDADIRPHAHFVCCECGAISDIFDWPDGHAALLSRGYFVERIKTVIYGVCPACKARAEKLS
ncbi:MAG: transcriptional repressor [Clostridia bacterium]|nr:transcriptional repressor [Clostridia bacterium]